MAGSLAGVGTDADGAVEVVTAAFGTEGASLFGESVFPHEKGLNMLLVEGFVKDAAGVDGDADADGAFVTASFFPQENGLRMLLDEAEGELVDGLEDGELDLLGPLALGVLELKGLSLLKNPGDEELEDGELDDGVLEPQLAGLSLLKIPGDEELELLDLLEDELLDEPPAPSPLMGFSQVEGFHHTPSSSSYSSRSSSRNSSRSRWISRAMIVYTLKGVGIRSLMSLESMPARPAWGVARSLA